MTKLRMFDDLPRATEADISKQILDSLQTEIYDLGEVIQGLNGHIPNEDFKKIWQGVEILLSVLTERFDQQRECEVKLIVSETRT